jgi:hypothetical protein
MKGLAALVVLSGLGISCACAQVPAALSGQYQCLQNCRGPGLAYVTQYGWNLNLVNEAGQPSRAWIDYSGHIWAQSWNEGAVYSPDGLTIQFDDGTVWQRYLGQGLPAVPAPAPEVPVPPAPQVSAPAAPQAAVPAAPGKRRATVPVRPAPAAATAFDGMWSVQIITESGTCDRAYRYGVRISNGDVVNESGEAANLQGRVAPNGRIRVSVSAGSQQASGEGRLSATTGSGTWRGEGSAGSCAGVWQAERRG